MRIRANARFLIKADITRFYPSIYTHSIPWALHGKAESKRDRRSKGPLWGNKIDELVRNVQDQQTIGIPIGPDTSRLIAESLLAKVDEILISRFPSINGIRFIDDYELGCHSRGEAEEVLECLQTLLSEYELVLNSTKTSIVELPCDVERPWIPTLRCFNFRGRFSKQQHGDLLAYFNEAYKLHRRYPTENVLQYTVARLNAVDITQQNWQLAQHLLSQTCLCEPAALKATLDQLIKYKSLDYPLDMELWTTTLNETVHQHARLGHASETAWALWMSLVIGVKLTDGASKAVAGGDDNVVGILALKAREQGLIASAQLDALARFCSAEDLLGRQWLICYEAMRRDWLKPVSGNPIAENDCFKALADAGVSFYDDAVVPVLPERSRSRVVDMTMFNPARSFPM